MAEIIADLPEGFLDELNLDKSLKSVLIEQINRFYKVRKTNISNKDIQFDELGRIIFPAGTIIHGTSLSLNNSHFVDKLVNISRTGILTGQAVGKEEEGETFYCADFHRVPHDMSVSEYNSWFPYVDGRCPFGRGKSTLAFVIQPNTGLDELLSYDCYRLGTANGDLTRRFVNSLPLKEEVASSILYGVPSNAISGIVMGDNLLRSSQTLDFVIRLFPDSYIISKTGSLIHDPKCSGIHNEELTELRRQSYLKDVEIDKLKRDLGYKEATITRESERYDKLLNGLLMTCPRKVVADVFSAAGAQGDRESITRYVDNLSDRQGIRRK